MGNILQPKTIGNRSVGDQAGFITHCNKGCHGTAQRETVGKDLDVWFCAGWFAGGFKARGTLL